MTTSSVTTFDPTFASILDEALERAGIDPSTTTHRHISSAKMSLNLMLTQWAALDGDALYRTSTTTQALSAADNDFTLPSGALDIIGDDMVMTYSSDTSEISIARISREDWLRIAVKTQTGRPTQFYVDQGVTLNTPTVYLWPVPDASVTMRYDYMRAVQTVTALSETLDVQRLWLEAVAAGLALRMAEKYNVERVPYLAAKEKETYMIARRAGSGNSQVRIVSRGFGNSSRQRRN